MKELKQQADIYRSRLAECRSQGEALIAQRNGEPYPALLVSSSSYFSVNRNLRNVSLTSVVLSTSCSKFIIMPHSLVSIYFIAAVFVYCTQYDALNCNK